MARNTAAIISAEKMPNVERDILLFDVVRFVEALPKDGPGAQIPFFPSRLPTFMKRITATELCGEMPAKARHVN
jgi:hypothetical protein